MWPIAFQDGDDFPAYVQREKLIELMVQMEAGVPVECFEPVIWSFTGNGRNGMYGRYHEVMAKLAILSTCFVETWSSQYFKKRT